jgi:hypothetical protein
MRGSDHQASTESFTVTLTLSVADAQLLWAAAAEKAMKIPGITLGDVLDTVGPREDPLVAECIALLAGPNAVAGCTLEDFEVREERRAIPAPAQLIALADARFAGGMRASARH